MKGVSNRQWLLLAAAILVSLPAMAARESDVANTRHNLSVSGTGTVKAVSQDEVCVFCHTPHGARLVSGHATPLWNRSFSTGTYVMYNSTSVQATIDANPGGASKLCLSCHDGTLAIGTLANAPGPGGLGGSVSMSGTGAGGVMPSGSGASTGFTRNLGQNLTNDHPISFRYDTALASSDGELLNPAVAGDHLGTRNHSAGLRPIVPLIQDQAGTGDAKVQCTSCHDPHIKDTAVAYSIKFLRLNRFQRTSEPLATFTQGNDIVCLACHRKEGWTDSAHAKSGVANETYTSAAASLREFPANIQVWEAACLNCHDTHTVQGARRLLREGTDSLVSPKSGGDSAIEETCYQCHTTAAASILSSAGNNVPDIRTEFVSVRRMPITSTDQQAGSEVHDISNADFSETQTLLGKTVTNRHVECTDCHNPHRVMKNRLFNGTGATTSGTHDHSASHTNIASGVLRGSWGVEPVYGSESFFVLPTSYTVKKGDGGLGASTTVTASHVTREYQICLKCHSDYGYNDNNTYPTGNRPNLGASGGGTPSGTNGLTQYTNQAREFQAPAGHQGEGQSRGTVGGAHADFNNLNHRSWHPVMAKTDRTLTARGGMSTAFFESPWDGSSDVGDQTMYCSDCHGGVSTTPSSVPATSPWGPHGSGKDFILRGDWDNETGTGQSDDLCFKCHDYTRYASADEGQGFTSGFSGSRDGNLHGTHNKRIGRVECSWCHIALPHGWKNKAFLVNLNDIGPEAGQSAGTGFNMDASGDSYTQQPYYIQAKNKIINFKASGNWEDSDCGDRTGRTAMIGAGGNTSGGGKNWMTNVCSNPP